MVFTIAVAIRRAPSGDRRVADLADQLAQDRRRVVREIVGLHDEGIRPGDHLLLETEMQRRDLVEDRQAVHRDP